MSVVIVVFLYAKLVEAICLTVLAVLFIFDHRPVYKPGLLVCCLCMLDLPVHTIARLIPYTMVAEAFLEITFTLLVGLFSMAVVKKLLPKNRTNGQRRIILMARMLPAMSVVCAAEWVAVSVFSKQLPSFETIGYFSFPNAGSISGNLIRALYPVTLVLCVVKPKIYGCSARETGIDRINAYSAYRKLTDRQTEVLAMVINKMVSKDIALALHLSEGTIRNHLMEIYHKAGVTSRTGLINDFLFFVNNRKAYGFEEEDKKQSATPRKR